MSVKAQLQALQFASGLRRQRVEAQMAAISLKRAALEQDLALLRGRSEAPLLGEDPAKLAQSEQHWHLWTLQKERDLLGALARLAAQRAELLPALRKSVGQDEALAALIEKENTKIAQKLSKSNF